MNKKLGGKVAIVTGASKGIGAEIARQLGAEGASVVVNYSTSKDGAEKVVADIARGGSKAVALQANMSDTGDVQRLFADSIKAFGTVDILVNNAGVYEFAPIEEVTPEHFHKQFNLNVLGLLLASQEAVKAFGTKGGNIINVSSVVSTATPSNSAVYSATKASVDAITKVLAQELGARKIRVNAVNPGMVETEGTHSAGITSSDFRKTIEAQTPLGRIGIPQDIAPAVVFLASADSGWTTGQTLQISGGFR